MRTIGRLAVIPIRSGSKGIKDKNIRPLAGKPLVAYTIDVAIRSKCFDKVFVSTDSEEYAQIARRYGADVSFLRSAETSTDSASTWDAIREVVNRFKEDCKEYEEIMVLQATSPLRNEIDIQNCIRLMREKDACSIESLTEMEHSPLWSNTLPADGSMDDFFNKYSTVPRQSLPKYYRENGAVYLIKSNLLELPDDKMFVKGCFAYIMPRERSIDIDTELDFKLAELLIKEIYD